MERHGPRPFWKGLGDDREGFLVGELVGKPLRDDEGDSVDKVGLKEQVSMRSGALVLVGRTRGLKRNED